MAKNKNHHLTKRGNVWYFQKMINRKWRKKALSESVTEARKERDRMLREILIHGDIQKNESPPVSRLFGEVAQQWAKIKAKRVKSSTWRDYRGSMNYYILPRFGDVPIADIGYLDIEEFISELTCSHKRIKNVLVPIRSLFKFALRAGLLEKSPMQLIESIKVTKADIHPLSMDEVIRFLEHVSARYRDFFVVAFFTGLRFGEMAALKWINVDFRMGVIRIRETRVRGEEGPPKTSGSVRDVKMLPPVIDALRDQTKFTVGKSEYVFLNHNNRPLLPGSVNYHVWKPALKKAGLRPRSLYQTRHTFATLMLDGREHPGRVQRMMGHESLKMILERYYSYIKDYQHQGGDAFMENVYNPVMKSTEDAPDSDGKFREFTPNLHQTEKRELADESNSPITLKKRNL